MDSSGLGGGFLSGTNDGILDLESPIHRHQHLQLGHQLQMNMMSGFNNDHHPNPAGLGDGIGPIQRGISMNFGKGKAVVTLCNNANNTSEDDEPSFPEVGNCENFNGLKGIGGSQWQRMKWTDNVVRLLIAVVACVGDDGSLEGEGPKKALGVLQKKGKWKTVSKIMISKGCYVSPQQCEDKFNDLNKRYKKLNDILGRGTSCRVVENPALMDSMPHLSEKMKDVVRKILSSKHLFYQEMCAYHNGQRIPNCYDLDLKNYSLPLTNCSRDNHISEEEDTHEHDDSEDDELDHDVGHHGDDVAGRVMKFERKRTHDEGGNFWLQSDQHDGFETELLGILQDQSKSLWERREWIRTRMSQLHEQRVSCLAEAIELEKRRFKWQRFCNKKDRELERAKLENDRKKLANEKMELLLKQKELELDLKRPETGIDIDPTSISRLQSERRDQVN